MLLLTLLLLWILVLCLNYLVPRQSATWSPQSMQHIYPGMSQSDVVSECGYPLQVLDGEKAEQKIWIYASPNVFDAGFEAYIILDSEIVVYACIEQGDLSRSGHGNQGKHEETRGQARR